MAFSWLKKYEMREYMKQVQNESGLPFATDKKQYNMV